MQCDYVWIIHRVIRAAIGKRANESLAKDGPNSICVYTMPAGRLPVTEWLWLKSCLWLCFVICQYCVARGIGINRITVMWFKAVGIQKHCHCLIQTVGWHAQTFHCLSFPSQITQLPCQRCAASCLTLSVLAKMCRKESDVWDSMCPRISQNSLSFKNSLFCTPNC